MKKRFAAMTAMSCLMLLLLLSACATQHPDTDILCENDPYNRYGAVLQVSLPSYTVETSDKHLALNGLNRGAAIEAFDTFALPMRDAGQADYWLPQYLSTVVIAIDREQTDAVITGWADLPESGLPVGMSAPDFNLLCAAVAYGMEGTEYSLREAARILRPIHTQGNLRKGDFDTPIIICLDHQAVAMNQAGRRLEIVVPAEGTLSFEKGLLSNTPLDLPDNHDALIAGGFRLLDGSCDERLYPPSADYERATVLDDYTHLNLEGQNTTKVYRRDIRGSHLYAAADGQEQQLTALLYLVAVMIWIGAIAHRAMQKGVRRAAIITGVLLACWMLARMLKFQLADDISLGRYLWYSYYIFELGIPLVLLWLSSAIDKPEGETDSPKWWRYCAAVNMALALLVMTNDLHQMAFHLDVSGNDWSSNYGYGPIFYAALAAISIELVLSQIMMLQKSRHSPQKLAFLFPLTFYILLVSYCVGYILRVPILVENDAALILGVFTLLSIEVVIRVGIIPVNRNYRAFFSQSPQKMQIIGDNGDTLLLSAQAENLPKEIWSKLKANPHLPQQSGEDELLYADPISGGLAVWHEDIRTLHALNRDLDVSIEQLHIANAVLERSVAVGRRRETPVARTELLRNLEKKIRSDFEKLANMVRQVPEGEARRRHLAQTAMLICYIKRKCHFFFLEQRIRQITGYELSAYTDELVEFASFAGIRCDSRFKATGNVPVRTATLIYDFFYLSFTWIHEHGGKALMLKLETGEAAIAASILYDSSIPRIPLDEDFLQEVHSAGGNTPDTMPAFLDSLSLGLIFPNGGDSHA